MTEIDEDDDITIHPDSANDPFYESLPVGERRLHDLIHWWFYLLRENADYEEYCEARRNGDVAACSKIKEDFPKVEEVFADFGDIHSPDLHTCGVASKGWQRWFAQRMHIFFPDQARLANPAYVAESPYRRNISIPANGRRSEIHELVETLVKALYAENEGQGKLSPRPLVESKYKINKGKVSTYLVYLEKAEFVNDLFLYNDANDGVPEEYRKYSAQQVERLILDIPEIHDIGFTWTRVPKSGGYQSSNNKKQIERLNKEFNQWIADSIHGLFPARVM